MKTEETNIHHIITQLASTSTSTPDFQDDEDLRTCRRCCNCYRQRFCCRPTCFLRSAAMPAEAAPGGMMTPDGNKKEQFWGVGPWGGLGWGGLGWGGLGWGRGWGWGCESNQRRRLKEKWRVKLLQTLLRKDLMK
ncbi:hypothetical protein KXD40_006821 [Peronospora effusa]|nr:hypothetical protein KXD40_006821 [Peronospora effusa]